MSKSDAQPKELQTLLAKPESELKEIVGLVKKGIDEGQMYISMDKGQSSIALHGEFVEKAKMSETNPREKVNVLSATVNFAGTLIHKAKSLQDANAKLYELPANLDSKVSFLATELIEQGLLSDIDYMQHAETPRLEVPLLSGTAKLRRLVSPINKTLYKCADVTIGVNDRGEDHILHFEVSLKELSRLIEELTDLREEIEKLPNVVGE